MRNYRARYEDMLGTLPEPNDFGEASLICPFHEDHKKSASLNFKTGLFFCMACEASHNINTFRKALRRAEGISQDKPQDKLQMPLGDVPAIPDQIARDYHFSLMLRQDVLDKLQEKRGLSLETIRKWQIGWDERTNRVTIPIRDDDGALRNVRLYSFDKPGQQKMLSWKLGYGTARLWPLEALTEDQRYVVLAEGEMDRLILSDYGINAVTSTGGAKTWKSEWSKHFEGQKVYICYDCDLAGEEGSRKAAASIAEHAKSVKVVRLDLGAGEDITDFFVSYGYGVNDLKEIIKRTPTFKKPIRLNDPDIDPESVWVTLGQSLQPRFRNTDLMVPVIVSARRDERLHYPQETMFSCDQSGGKVCERCALYGSGERTVAIKPNDSGIIDFVGISTNFQRSLVRKRAGIPTRCEIYESSTTESGTIEEILVTPELETASLSDDSMHLIQRAFYVGLGLDYNASYVIKSRPVPFHKTSKIVHHVIDATPSRDSIESFEMTDELHERLKAFQATQGRVKWKLAEIATDLQDHVTRIWDRLDIHIGMDLIWHSVLEFEFDSKKERRGWLETCVVGDTRTGKSEIATQLQRHYGYGEIVSGENTSYAGLVGGAIKYDDAWFVKWGRIPLNDKRMVVIDEVTGMNTDDIALMSGVRETGIADVTKIETQRANARTRAIWIGNVRGPKQDLSDYDYGCLALHDLIGQPEDIARFDYALVAARDEVSPQTVNSSHKIRSRQRYPSDLCSELVLWVWSRSADEVQFQREAVEACWKHAITMGETYSSTLPLVMAENQRIKLARIAAAIAARVFSTTDGENLIVTAEHVDVARWLLDKFYSKESFGYMQLSKQKAVFANRRHNAQGKVIEYLKSRPLLADQLSRAKLVNASKIADYTGIGDDDAKEVLRLLTSTMMVEDKGSHGYSVTNELRIIAEKIVPSDYALEEQ